MPIFLLDRLPFDPWQRLTRDYVRRRWQRAWPPYDATRAFWQWCELGTQPPTTNVAPTSHSVAGALRIKNEARHIREVLTAALGLCERVLIFDDHSVDDTPEICRSYGDRVIVLPSPFQGLDEARDKNYLLRHLVAADPEWVLWIDGDEVLERTGPAQIRQSIACANGANAFALRIAYLWNRPDIVRVDGIYGRFYRPSLFRLRGQPVDRLYFPATSFGANFHCGNVPRGIRGGYRNINVRLKHYGYMDHDQREDKYRWYNQNDPDNAAEDYYRHIGGIVGAKFAPGPPRFVRWTE